jgi:hypothetical protein
MAQTKEALLKELKGYFIQLQKIDKGVLKYLPKELIETIKKGKNYLNTSVNNTSTNEELIDSYKTLHISRKLFFKPRTINIQKAWKDIITVDFPSDISPPYVYSFKIPNVPFKQVLVIKGSPENKKESYEIIVTEEGTTPFFNISTLEVELTLEWDAGEEHVTKTDAIESCDRLIYVGYQNLENGIKSVHEELSSTERNGVNYFRSIGIAYTDAYKGFTSSLEKLNGDETDKAYITSSIVTLLSVGALSWVSKIIEIADLIEDVTTVAIDKMAPPLLAKSINAEEIKKKIGIQDSDVYAEWKINKFVSSVGEIDSKIRNAMAYIYENKKDVSDYCKASELNHYLDVYSKVSDKIKKLINDLIPSLKKYQKNITVVNEGILAKEFEYNFWMRWISTLKTWKQPEEGEHPQMGNRTDGPHYPLPGQEDVDRDYEYNVHLSEEIVKKFKDLKIGNLKTNGNGRVYKGQLATLIKKAEKESKEIKISL